MQVLQEEKKQIVPQEKQKKIRIGNQTAISSKTVWQPFEYAISKGFDAFEWFPDKFNTGLLQKIQYKCIGWKEKDIAQEERKRIKETAIEKDMTAAGPDPAAAPFPELGLPWAQGERWWMTGGPHGGWGNGSAWAALDFVPEGEERGCFVAPQWATAVADGVLIDGAVGEVWLDLDGDGRRETGPAVQYLHLAADERTPGGTRVRRGDRIGHPSCEGGFSNATHVHIARMYDGEWLAAAGAAPMVLAGWRAAGAAEVYDGGLHHTDGRVRTACECRLDGENDVAW